LLRLGNHDGLAERPAVATEGEAVSDKDESDAPEPPAEPSHHNYDSRPIPDRVLAVFLAVLAVALVLGYLFVNKMVDISRQEVCVLARRSNCATTDVSPSR
jgi:hypothetical protein